MSGLKKLKLFIGSALLLVAFTMSASIPPETIVAEFDGGTITLGYLEERIELLPPMYQPKYSLYEGKKELLNDICTEELFYQEAIQQNVRNDERYFNNIDPQIKSVYYGEFKKDIVDEKIQYTEAEKIAFFNENSQLFPAATYEEAKEEIEKRMRPLKEKEIMQLYKDKFFDKYQIAFQEDAIMQFNLTNIDSNLIDADLVLIESNHPDLQLTKGELAEKWDSLPEQNTRNLRSNEDLKRYLEYITEQEVFFLEAVEKGYDKNENVLNIIEQIHRNMMLRTIYNQLVVDPIKLDTESLKNYYNENIEQFSTKPYRKIQTFGFESEAVAKKMLKEVRALVKKADEEALKELISQNSIYSNKNGVIDHIYQNDIIPGIGKDEVYSQYVWNTKPNKFSKIFKNSKDVWVFLQVLEDVKAVATPFAEIEEKVKKDKMNTESRAAFEKLKESFIDKYNLKVYPERMIEILSAEEYFNKAESAQKRRRFNDAIYYYEEVIKHYKNNSDDYKATFMKGFLYAEELKDKENALISFRQVLSDFPEAELHESAQFMIDELEGKTNLIDQFESETNKSE